MVYGWKANELDTLVGLFQLDWLGLGIVRFTASHRRLRSLSARVVALWHNLVE